MATSKEPFMDIGRFILERRPTAGCQEPGCTAEDAHRCVADLRGRKDGVTCDRRMCGVHAAMAPTGPLCAPHGRQRQQERLTKGGSA